MWKNTKGVPKPISRKKTTQNFALFWIIGAFVAFILTNCRHEPPKLQEEKDYFPLKVGQVNYYQRNMQRFRSVGTATDTLRDTLFIKERIIETYKDALGQTVYRFDIDTCGTHDGNYVFYKHGIMFRERNECIRSEANLAQVVLHYPVSAKTVWDGNKYNGLGAVNFRYIETGKTMILGSETFYDCAVVEQKMNDPTFIQDLYTYEVFAPEVGKIKRYDRHLLFIYKGDPESPPVFDENSYIYEDFYFKKD